jgi:hypothetical protein
MLLLAMGFTSCSDDTLGDINKNPNNPTDVASKLIITEVINSTAFTITGSDLAFYASSYVEHNVGIYNQLYNAEIRTIEPQSSTTYNNMWGSLYTNLLNLKTIIQKCSPDGDEPDNTVVLGMAQVLSAYDLAILTDLFGDVPWTEALQPGIIMTPDLDTQENIYAAINKFLADGIDNLKKETSVASIGNQDPIYKGDAAKWLKFAYGLQARYAMRLSAKNANYDAVINAVGQSFASKAEECAFKCGTITNPFQRFFNDRDYFGASQSLHDKLATRNDPRDDVYFVPYPGADELIFAPNGSPTQVQGLYGISGVMAANAPILLLSYHELLFLKAEALARKGGAIDNAKSALKDAITAAFVNAGLKAADAETYYADKVESRLTSQTETLKEIMIQKYISQFEMEAIEAYNDVRRLKAMGNGDFITLANTKRFPLRYSYGADDVTTNVNISVAYGDGSYIYTENVWWAGGNR